MTFLPALLGGLALFLYGMDMMGNGLELLAGNRLQSILEKLTSNKLMGVLVGAAITAIIQSSSATTVMAVGFVNSKIMTLSQAIYIIMGANIGTTVTGQLLRLDMKSIAPIIAFIGMVLFMFSNKRKLKHSGQITLGLGLLFMGMGIMGDAVSPLKDNEAFQSLISQVSNPFVAIIIGTVVTAILQSSSATNGILQTLAANGLIAFNTSYFIILGQNIGTCITSILASIGASKNAKRAAASHVLFNVFGTVVFSILALSLPIIPMVAGWTPASPKAQIANMHTLFNVITTVILLPFTGMLARAANHIVKGEDQDASQIMALNYINKNTISDSIIMVASVKQEIIRMYNIAKTNIKLATGNFEKFNEEISHQIELNEELLDFLNSEITSYTVKNMTQEFTKEQSKQLSYYIKIISNIERIGDYAYNINNLAKDMKQKNLNFSEEALKEIKDSIVLIDQLFDEMSNSWKDEDFDLNKIRTTAFRITDLVEKNRINHLERMQTGECNTETGLIYDKYYTYYIRAKDHIINITNSLSAIH